MFSFCFCFRPKKYGGIAKQYLSDIKYLENIQYTDTTIFIPPISYGKVVKVYDGDTITVASTLPYLDSPIYRFRVRLRGIDSPEMNGSTVEEKNAAIESRDKLRELILNKIVKIENRGTEKWGRLLADIYLEDIYVNKWLLKKGLAKPYFGEKKDLWN
jgi:endonuclease YncB( thermonuclease family)